MMECFLRATTSDFGSIASATGFKFNQYSGSVDWENLDKFVVKDIIENTDVKSLSTLVFSVLSYNIEKMSVSSKIFRFSQLIIDFLLHYKKHSRFKFNGKADSMTLCELCGKLFMDVSYLNYHCFRCHKLNSCTYMSSPENDHVESLKLEILQLQTQLKEIKSNFQNNFQDSKTYFEMQNFDNCHAVHKNKLLYNVQFQSGDTHMQTQEMYWKQKYDNLNENYNIFMNEYKNKQSTAKITTDFQQQCDLYRVDKFSKYVQTESSIKNTTPKRLPRNIDVVIHKINNKIDNIDVSDSTQTNLENQQRNGNHFSDRDFDELKKLRLEAQNNIAENNKIEDYFEPLLSCDYAESFKIVITLGNAFQNNKLFENSFFLNLIKYDIKELINIRLEECYKFKNKDLEQDNNLPGQKDIENSILDDCEIEQDNNLEIDSDNVSVKKNKTVMYKLKKRALHLGKIFNLDSKKKNTRTQLSTEL